MAIAGFLTEKEKQHQLGLVLKNSQTDFSHLYVMTEWAVRERQTPFLYNPPHRADQSEIVTVCSPLHIEKGSELGNASCLFPKRAQEASHRP